MPRFSKSFVFCEEKNPDYLAIKKERKNASIVLWVVNVRPRCDACAVRVQAQGINHVLLIPMLWSFLKYVSAHIVNTCVI